jgi:hypothetical protein
MVIDIPLFESSKNEEQNERDMDKISLPVHDPEKLINPSICCIVTGNFNPHDNGIQNYFLCYRSPPADATQSIHNKNQKT